MFFCILLEGLAASRKCQRRRKTELQEPSSSHIAAPTDRRLDTMLSWRRAQWAFLFTIHALTVLGAGQASFYGVTYVSFSSNVATPPPATQRVALGIVSGADDSPFQRMVLPFPFTYFGVDLYAVYVSPNGAVHVTQQQPCACNCFMMQLSSGTFCDFNRSYTGLVAGFLTDLDPSSSGSTGNVTYFRGADGVTVVYTSIPLFPASDGAKPTRQSFRIGLYNDSRVEIAYDTVFPNQTKSLKVMGDYPQLLSGLRPPGPSAGMPLLWNATADQMQVASNQWFTSVPGVYPPYKEVRSGRQFTACPFSLTWTASPRYVDVSVIPSTTSVAAATKAAALANLYVTLTPLLMSCGRLLDVALAVNATAFADPSTSDYARCRYRLSTGGVGAQQALVCNLTTLSPASLAAGDKQVRLAWRVKGSGSTYTAFPGLRPIPLTFYITPPSPLPAASCAFNSGLPGGYCAATAAADQLCSGNYTCLRRPCAGKAASAQTAQQQAATLFQYPACARALRDFRNASCATNLVLDKAKTCCTADQTDCAGVCFGKSQVAMWAPNGYPKTRPTHRTWICCPSDSVVDCGGYCVGPGQKGLQRDACGKCGGTDKKGMGCSTGVKVVTGWGYNELYYFIDYAAPTQVRAEPVCATGAPPWRPFSHPYPCAPCMQLWAVSPINISNTNTTGVMVNFSLAGSIYASPEVSLNIPVATNVYIGPLSNLVVPVNFSMRRVFVGLAQAWTVKTLIISYWRPAISGSLSFNYVVDTFPQGRNCSKIASASACVRVPACILCPIEPQIRVLMEADGEAQGEVPGAEEGSDANVQEEDDGDGEGAAGASRMFQKIGPFVPDLYPGVEPPAFDGHAWWDDVDEEEEEEEKEGRGVKHKKPHGRALYTGLVPGQLGDTDDPAYLAGTCVDGFMSGDCPFPSAATRASPFTAPAAPAAVALALAALAVLLSVHH